MRTQICAHQYIYLCMHIHKHYRQNDTNIDIIDNFFTMRYKILSTLGKMYGYSQIM